MSRVKVVILNWNGTEHLRRFLPSIIATTPRWADIIVADNGSTDGSTAMLEVEFPEVGIVRLDRNYGFAGGYNKALHMVEADYCVLLNSDVEPATGWLEPLVEALDADAALFAVQPKILSLSDRSRFEYAGACGGFMDMLGYPFCRGRIMSCTEYDHGQYDTFRHCFWASGACMAIRMAVFDEAGGFDDDFFAHMEEIDLCWRAQRIGYRIAVEPASTVYHLGGGTLPATSPRKTYLNFRNSLYMLYKNLPANRLWPIIITRMLLDGAAAAVYLLQGKFSLCKAVWNAHMDFYRHRQRLRMVRRELSTTDTRSTIEGIYRHSIVIRYLSGRKYFGTMM